MENEAYTCTFYRCLNATQGLYCKEHSTPAKRVAYRHKYGYYSENQPTKKEKENGI